MCICSKNARDITEHVLVERVICVMGDSGTIVNLFILFLRYKKNCDFPQISQWLKVNTHLSDKNYRPRTFRESSKTESWALIFVMISVRPVEYSSE